MLSPLPSHELGRWERKNAGVSLLSAVALLVCIPADLEGECDVHFSRLHFSPVQCLQTEWGGGRKGCRWVLISEAVCLVCMLGVGSESASDVLFHVFGFSIFLEQGTGGEDFGGRLPSAVALFCTHDSV